MHRWVRAAGRVVLAIFVGTLAVATSFQILDAPWANRWGSTSREAEATLPGDGLVRVPILESTRAITIEAPVSDAWPWLVQFGAGRGGLYSYDIAERLAGMDIHNASRVLASYQQLSVGDTLWVTPEGYPANLAFKVVAVVPEPSLVLAFTKDAHAAALPADPGWTWSFTLQPVTASTSRLISRQWQSSLGNPIADVVQRGLVGPIGFVLDRKTLIGIGDRAETLAGSRSGLSPAEAIFWVELTLGGLGALAIAVARRPRWRLEVGMGAIAAVVLGQILFRGFPNPWLGLAADALVAFAGLWAWAGGRVALDRRSRALAAVRRLGRVRRNRWAPFGIPGPGGPGS